MIPHPASPTRGDHLRAIAPAHDKPEPITRAQGGGRHADRFDELRADLGPFWLAWIAIYVAGCAGSLWLTVLIVRAWLGH